MRARILAAAIILLALAGCENYVTEPRLSIWPPQITETDAVGNILNPNDDWPRGGRRRQREECL